MKVYFSIIGRKWKSISVCVNKAEYIIRLYSYHPFIRVDKLLSTPAEDKK